MVPTDSLTDLAEVESIKRVKALYCRLLDAGQRGEWLELFTPDAVIADPALAAEPLPPDRYLDALGRGAQETVTVHHCHMPEVNLQDEARADATWALHELVEQRSGGRAAARLGYGYHNDSYRKANGDWRICGVEVTRLREQRIEGRERPLGARGAAREDWVAAGPSPVDPRELADREAIQQLKARYFRLLDSQRWDEWRRLFSDSARFHGTAVAGEHGVDAFVEGVAGNLRGATTVHHGHLPEIDFTGPDSARGTWALNDYVVPATNKKGYGRYQEAYVREGGEWRIAELNLSYPRTEPPTEPLVAEDHLRLDREWLEGTSAAAPDRLPDLEAIKRLKAAYFRLLDQKRWDEWRGLFCQDLRVIGSRTPGEGVDRFVESVSAWLARARTVHQGHVPEIRFVDGGTARGVWPMFDWVDREDGPAPRRVMGYGHYQEEYRKEAGRWRIGVLRLSRLRVDRLA
jgi:hypothetical protein